MNFGNVLKTLRETVHLTQKQMSEILGVSKSNISKYESGAVEPNIDTLKRYASYFKVSTDYLLGLKKSGSDTNDCYNYFYEEGDANWSIRKISKEKEISYEDMLEKSCIEKTRLDAIWYGNSQPVAEELIRIATVLDVSIDYLLDHSQRERIHSDEEIILRYYHRFPKEVMGLLKSFCVLEERDRIKVLGKCFDLEDDKPSVAADEQYADSQGKSQPSSGTGGDTMAG